MMKIRSVNNKGAALVMVIVAMMFVGIIIAAVVFLVTAWVLTKRNHQDFLKLFYRLP